MYLQEKRAYILTETHFGEVFYFNDSYYVRGEAPILEAGTFEVNKILFLLKRILHIVFLSTYSFFINEDFFSRLTKNN